VAGSEGAAIHAAAAARDGEPIVVKHRISPFVGTDLETLLRANGIDTLVLAGVLRFYQLSDRLRGRLGKTSIAKSVSNWVLF
jgi:isochorismate hydrolase